MLAHKAVHEGHVAAEAAAGMKSHFDARVVPSVAYTDPEIAWVGITEEEAKEKGIAVKVGKFNFTANGRAIANDTTEGFAKIIADAKTDKVLGAHIVGEGATELIHIGQAVINLKGTVDYFVNNTFNFPTLAEAYKIAGLDAWNRMSR